MSADPMDVTDDQLAGRRRALELEQLSLAEEECKVRRTKLEAERSLATSASERIVRLNVGGVHFDTSRETLLFEGGSLFHRLLAEPDAGSSYVVGAQRDAEGRIFIDRDPELFRLLLQGMRGSLSLSALSPAQHETLLAEAQYFQLARLATHLADGYDPYALSPADLALQVQAAQLRERLGQIEAEAAKAAAEDGDGVLIDVFAQAESFVYTGVRTSPDVEYLFDRPLLHPRPKLGEKLEVKTAKEFRKRLDAFAGPLLARLELTDLVVAGGAVLQALKMGPGWSNPQVSTGGVSDIDLFIVCDTDEAAKLVYTRVLNHLKTALEKKVSDYETSPTADPHYQLYQHEFLGTSSLKPLWERQLLVTRSKTAVTFVAGWPQRNIQLVLRRHTCVADIIFGFDVDACQLAYDGKRVLATPSAQRALTSGVNLADPERSTSSYEKRLYKYAQRGFAVGVPGLDMRRVERGLRDGVFTFDGGMLRKLSLQFMPDAKVPLLQSPSAPITGLPKLLVLDAIDGSEHLWEKPLWSHFTPSFSHEGLPDETDPPTSDGTAAYLLKKWKLEKVLAEDGSVWKVPHPSRPPTTLRQNLMAEDDATEGDEYTGGVVLPFTSHFHSAKRIAKRLKKAIIESIEGATPLAVVYELITDLNATDEPPKVADACNFKIDHGLQRRGSANLGELSEINLNAPSQFYNVVLESLGFPRHIEFAPSSVTGFYGRLPPDAWFRGAYASGRAAADAGGSAERAGLQEIPGR